MRLFRASVALSIFASLTLLVGASASARAQAGAVTAGLSANVDILDPPLSGAGVRPLDFGLIIPGTTNVVVAPRTPQGGEFRIAGTRNRRSLDISFALPTALVGPSGATIPLDFNGAYAALCELDDAGVCQTASIVSWNPVTTPTFRDTPQRYKPGRPRFTFDQYDVFLGGRVLPAAGQRPGKYTATMGITLVLN